MKRETILKKIPYDESSDDDFSEYLLIKAANLSLDEFNSPFNRDLLSGRDWFDMDIELDEGYVCLDNFIASQMYSY